MKEELISKLLQEQTTPEEEHLIGQLLRQQEQEDINQWLIEDETETYDRMVGQQRAKHRLVRWAIAAVIALFMVAGTVILWPREDGSIRRDNIVTYEVAKVPAVAPKPIAPTRPTQAPVLAKRTAVKPVAKPVPKDANTADSLQIYIERLEQELLQVTDSSYVAKAEQIIRADARLQRLVQRIMIGEIEKSNQPIEAMITNEMKEEQP